MEREDEIKEKVAMLENTAESHSLLISSWAADRHMRTVELNKYKLIVVDRVLAILQVSVQLWIAITLIRIASKL